jgi:hypothetical protein
LRAILVFLRLFNAATQRARHRNHRVTAGKTRLPKQLSGRANPWQGRAKLERMHTYSGGAVNQPAAQGGSKMAFKPNYRRDRAERQKAARARSEEKQRKKEEKAALRKAEREAGEAPPEEKQTTGQP